MQPLGTKVYLLKRYSPSDRVDLAIFQVLLEVIRFNATHFHSIESEGLNTCGLQQGWTEVGERSELQTKQCTARFFWSDSGSDGDSPSSNHVKSLFQMAGVLFWSQIFTRQYILFHVVKRPIENDYWGA